MTIREEFEKALEERFGHKNPNWQVYEQVRDQRVAGAKWGFIQGLKKAADITKLNAEHNAGTSKILEAILSALKEMEEEKP